MKWYVKVIKWSMLALVIELAAFIYVDKFYLSEIKDFSAKKVETQKPEVKTKKDIKIPQDAKFVSISYEGKYVSYIQNGEVTVINRETEKAEKVALYEGTTATYLKWLDEKELLFIAEKGKGVVRFSSYNPVKAVNNQWKESSGKESKLYLPDSKYEVKDIARSSYANVTYVNVGTASRSIIYRFDIMSEVTKSKDLYGKIGKLGATQLEDKLIYEDLTHNKLYVEGYPNMFKNKGISNPCILGFDFEDTCYFGNKSGDKVTEIYYGALKTPLSQWTKIPLDKPEKQANVIISTDGKMCINNALEGTITDLKTNKISTYKGKFVALYKSGIVSIENDMLIENKIEQ